MRGFLKALRLLFLGRFLRRRAKQELEAQAPPAETQVGSLLPESMSVGEASSGVGVAIAPPQAFFPPFVEEPTTLGVVGFGAPLDKKRMAAVAGVMSFLKDEAVEFSQMTTSFPGAWRIAGRRFLIGSRGRPRGRRGWVAPEVGRGYNRSS